MPYPSFFPTLLNARYDVLQLSQIETCWAFTNPGAGLRAASLLNLQIIVRHLNFLLGLLYQSRYQCSGIWDRRWSPHHASSLILWYAAPDALAPSMMLTLEILVVSLLEHFTSH